MFIIFKYFTSVITFDTHCIEDTAHMLFLQRTFLDHPRIHSLAWFTFHCIIWYFRYLFYFFIHLFSFFSTRKMCISQGKKNLSYSPLYTQYLELYLVHIQCSKYIIIWHSPARKIRYLWSWGSKFSRASWFASGTEPISNTSYLPLLASIWTPLEINFEPKFNYAWYLENTI